MEEILRYIINLIQLNCIFTNILCLVFARPDFIWPSTMNINERREVFDYIIYPDWDPIGEELAKNTIGYRRLLESGTLDESKGTHILIVHGELVNYEHDISPE